MSESLEERARLLDQSAAIRRQALTEEQRARRAAVARRTALISSGVKPPASGVFGKPKPAR